MGLPDLIENEEQLNEVLTRPTDNLAQSLRSIEGPLVILGAGGKMGPTLAVMARRAAPHLEVIAVSRFTDTRAKAWLEQRGVRAWTCDLLDDHGVRCLPDTANLIYLVGMKFGTSDNPSTTWVMNTVVPGRVAERFPGARIVALSTGNVYPNSLVAAGGSLETDALTPVGEYGNSAVGRERVFEFYSRKNQTPITILRLLYAVDLRYGVIVDIAHKVWNGEPIPLANGSFNCIWQGDANELVLRSLALAKSPPAVFNLCHSKICSVRDVATRLGALLGKTPNFSGEESGTALLACDAKLEKEIGAPQTSIETMIRWTAHWIKTGGRNLGKPTHFEVRDGKY